MLLAKIDGTTVGTVTDTSYGSGEVGLGTAGYYPVQYANLSITPGTATDLSGTYKIVSVRSGRVLDVVGAGTANGTLIDQWTDNGGANQQWVIAPLGNGAYGIESRSDAYQLDVTGNSTANGAKVDQWTYNGNSNQQWQLVRIS